MPLPLHFRVQGPRGVVRVELVADGLAFRGETAPRPDLAVHVWDALVQTFALDEMPAVHVYLGEREATRRITEARAALQVRLRGR